MFSDQIRLIKVSSISAVPPFPGLRRFPDGRDFAQWTGDDSKALMKVRTTKYIVYAAYSFHMTRSTSLQLLAMSLPKWSSAWLRSWTSATLCGAMLSLQMILLNCSISWISSMSIARCLLAQLVSQASVYPYPDNTPSCITSILSFFLAPRMVSALRSLNQNTSKP
jgi:hypothetical protein